MQRSHQDTLDTLQFLSELNDNSVRLHQTKVDQRAYELNVADLRETARRLQMEEAELKMRLVSAGTSKPLHQVLKTKLSDALGTTEAEAVATEPVMNEVAQAAKKNVEQHKLNEIYIAYRLAGCSVFNVSETRIGVRFDTFFKGRYYECYYVFLDSDPETGAASVYRHTLPYFIDMDELKQTLARDVKEFLSAVEDALGALVSRRQQVIQVEKEFTGRIHDIFCSHAFDLVQGSIVCGGGEQGASEVFEFQLKFAGLLETVPKKISIKAVGDGDDLQTRPDLQRKFMAAEGLLVDRVLVVFGES